MPDQVRISSDEEAWALLEELLANEFEDEDVPELQLDGWPIFDLASAKGEAEISTTTMQGFLTLQSSVRRTYLTYAKGYRDLRGLDEDSRSKLELSVKVEQGSSIFKVELDEQVKEFGRALLDKVSGRDVIIAILAGGLIFAGQSVWKAHIAENARVRIAEVQSAETRQVLEGVARLSEEETRRMEILGNAYEAVPETRVSEEEASEARQELLKSLPPGYRAVIEGIDLPSEALEEIIKTQRQLSEEVTVQKTYFIERAQTTEGGFQVRLRDVETNQFVSAGFGEILTSAQERALVWQAFTEKRPILLTLAARQRGEQITSAQIRAAELPAR